MRLLDLESQTMLTALGLAFLLWQPGPSCPSCGGQGAGHYPLATYTLGHGGVWQILQGEVWGLQANKCVCTLGSSVPGGDYWAFQMHGGFPVSAPVSVPVPAPA